MPPKAPSLAQLFRSYPFRFFTTFAEAVSVAKRCPDGCRVVWFFNDGSTREAPWRVGRNPEMVAKNLADPGPWLQLVWQDGTALVSMDWIAQHDGKPKLKAMPANDLLAAKRFAHIDLATFERFIESKRQAGCDVGPAVEYRESLGPNPPPMPPELDPEAATATPSWQPMPPEASEPPPVKAPKPRKAPEAPAAGSVSIPVLIESLKAAGLPAEQILEIIAKATR